ncbi:MAG TPA: hypothetical protein DHV22_09880, partial [Xanthomarina gelatinilytica]|nr:hypothetical protein [Xanthomarina gelatinilytica]
RYVSIVVKLSVAFKTLPVPKLKPVMPYSILKSDSPFESQFKEILHISTESTFREVGFWHAVSVINMTGPITSLKFVSLHFVVR